jgi:hypothetical protein
MNAEKRAVSRIPAIPNTRSFGQAETFLAMAHRVERVGDDDQDRIRLAAITSWSRT